MSEKESQITLIDEEGHEHEFTLVDVVQWSQRQYAALSPADDEDGAVVILRIDQDDEGNDVLSDIEDDEEFDQVVEVLAEEWQEEEVDPEEGHDDDTRSDA